MSFIAVSHLSKAYGPVPAVADFSFEVERGETFALVGPDGAGKTTIMRILCNLLSPDSGTASMGNLDLLRDFGRVKPLLGYMPQSFSLYPDLSVEENLIFYAGIYGLVGGKYRQRRDKLYGFSNLGPFSKRRAGALSGGMKQKLALSCALIHEPQILILDEPTTGVDPLSRRQFWEILTDFKRQGVTMIVCTPYMDEVARTDRACFIFGGKKLAEGTPQELTGMFEGKIYFLDSPPTATLIEQLDDIEQIRAMRFGSGLHLYTDMDRQINEFADALRSVGVDPDRLVPMEPDLEDCFIQLMERTSD